MQCCSFLWIKQSGARHWCTLLSTPALSCSTPEHSLKMGTLFLLAQQVVAVFDGSTHCHKIFAPCWVYLQDGPHFKIMHLFTLFFSGTTTESLSHILWRLSWHSSSFRPKKITLSNLIWVKIKPLKSSQKDRAADFISSPDISSLEEGFLTSRSTYLFSKLMAKPIQWLRLVHEPSCKLPCILPGSSCHQRPNRIPRSCL